MLRQRVITAIVLLALLLPALFAASPWPFALLTLVLIGAAGWEWGRLNAAGGAAIAIGVLLALACAVAAWLGWAATPPRWLWWPVAAAWIVAGAFALRAGPAGWPAVPMPLRWLLGLVMLWVAWLALAHARHLGINFILSVLCLVWMADIAAYFGGRAFGRRKLAPTISPGKSWEGVWSGVVGVIVLALLWRWVDASQPVDSPSLYSRIELRWGWLGLLVGVALLAAMSVVGDLFESLVKRSAGAKDSSGLLPGHGGVLDRVDALLPVFPIAMALVAS
ncbi:phosphatidate cytidylyltransferase [Variovorax sp. YR752]|uniref:phosphatidate cytidylyltransferase n=1 Tax=Variovorax sp. YR752 TaxID=1884383 RepID=UPI00313830E2